MYLAGGVHLQANKEQRLQVIKDMFAIGIARKFDITEDEALEIFKKEVNLLEPYDEIIAINIIAWSKTHTDVKKYMELVYWLKDEFKTIKKLNLDEPRIVSRISLEFETLFEIQRFFWFLEMLQK